MPKMVDENFKDAGCFDIDIHNRKADDAFVIMRIGPLRLKSAWCG
jgi:hypothetical protein